jgi:hypothetical protein
VGSELSSANVDSHGSSVTDGIVLMGGTIQSTTGLSLTGEVTTLAGPAEGSSAFGDNDSTTASNARFKNPYGMTTDGTNLYVSEYGNHKIRKIVISTGVVTTLAGPAEGSTAYGDNDSTTASNARFKNPYGMTSDGTNLYVADFGNNKIRKIVISTGVVTTLAGPAEGTTTAETADGTGNDARFDGPFAITTDGTNLYVGTGGNKIRKIVISSGVVTTLAGPAEGSTAYGDNDSTTASNARFYSPYGITTDGTNLYVVDYRNNKIRKVVIDNGTVTTYAGPAEGSRESGDNDSTTASNARFGGPVGITSDGTNFYVSEYGNHKIRKIVISTGVVTTLAGPAEGSQESGDNDSTTASNARFYGPANITTDGTYLYVADYLNNKIRKIE